MVTIIMDSTGIEPVAVCLQGSLATLVHARPLGRGRIELTATGLKAPWTNRCPTDPQDPAPRFELGLLAWKAAVLPLTPYGEK